MKTPGRQAQVRVATPHTADSGLQIHKSVSTCEINVTLTAQVTRSKKIII